MPKQAKTVKQLVPKVKLRWEREGKIRTASSFGSTGFMLLLPRLLGDDHDLGSGVANGQIFVL